MSAMGYLRHLESWEVAEGAPAPLGATWVASIQSWNFALYSRYATGVTVLLYRATDTVNPVHTVTLDPLSNKSGRIWHVMVAAADAPDAVYFAWRVAGPRDPGRGLLFDPSKLLLDPFARRLHFPDAFSREAAKAVGVPNDGQAVLAVLPHHHPGFNGDHNPVPRHTHDMVVYEVHVRGFTRSDTSGVIPENRGTFRGLIEKIPYLKALGVTVVELLPVHQFDPQEGNYWGYMTLNFFAPHNQYANSDAIAEFREMVAAMHEAGIEVWLDVVYNHTAEAGADGPTYNLRGIDNTSYYLVGPDGVYDNASGCGNSTRGAYPAVRMIVVSSLRYWAREMGVDGFRFDLASILARDFHGQVTDLPALIAEISALAAQLDVRVVAEAWDMGAYLLGKGFPGIMWRQWNGKFRDDLRGFVRGDEGLVPALMTRVYGSADLFPDGPGDTYRPYQSVNFITAHDGFCLYDLVSYNHKHNLANGHDNTDGTDDNRSWNCGHEGDDGVPAEVVALRHQQMRNFATLLMVSNGVPMIVAGDEFANTQGGNNNPYNQDNPTTWLDWDRLAENQHLFDFWAALIAWRKSHKGIARSRFWREDVTWFGVAGPVDMSPSSRSVGWFLRGDHLDSSGIAVLVNAWEGPLRFDLAQAAAMTPDAWPTARNWRRIVDTAQAAEPFSAAGVAVTGWEYTVAARSVVVLEGLETN